MNTEMEWDALYERLFADAPEDSFGQPASENSIRSAEARLNIKFPEDFRYFLSRYGYADWPETIYGVGEAMPAVYSLLENLRQEQEEVGNPMPSGIIPFSPNGWGDHYCLDYTSPNDIPWVCLWRHDYASVRPLPETPTFFEWLQETINEL